MIKAIIVDDEKWSRNIIKNFGNWQELGIEIVGEAEDGEEGLKLIEAHQPHLILTDMNMPVLDGVGLLQTINQKANDMKIIVISGFDDYEYMKQAIRSKAFEYILKPINAIELNRALAQCVQEICRHDHLMVYERVDKVVLEYVIEKRKLLKILIDEKDLEQIHQVFHDMVSTLEKMHEDEKMVTRLVDDSMVLLIREEIILPVSHHDTLATAYKEIRKEVENGLCIATYFQKIRVLFEEGLKQLHQMLEKEHQPIAVMVKSYIDEAYKENISLEKIAKHFFVSKEYLSGAFKSKFQINMSQYILQLKMRDAKQLIEAGVSYNQVAQRMGYQDLSYFYKVFKKYYGCPPGDYKCR